VRTSNKPKVVSFPRNTNGCGLCMCGIKLKQMPYSVISCWSLTNLGPKFNYSLKKQTESKIG
jgi:hypothetical protein